MNQLIHRLIGPLSAAAAIYGILVAASWAYSSFGGAASDNIVTQMLINTIIVIGMQAYIGNTGVLSFGHVGFGAVAGYTFAVLAISVERKAVTIRNAPFGLGDIQLSPWLALLVAVVVTLVLAMVVGLGLARSSSSSGAISATVITLAVLFMAHEVAVNWDELTGGDRGGLSFSVGSSLSSRTPIHLAVIGALALAFVYARSRSGRIAMAAREDALAARAMGHEPAVHQTMALAVSIVIVAVGASLRVYQLGSITPRFFFFEFTLLTLTMLIVGGRNSVTGAVVGVVVITVGNEIARYLAGPQVEVAGFVFRAGLSGLFLGLSMIGFMIFRPKGLLEDWDLDTTVVGRWRRSREAEAPDFVATTVKAEGPNRLSVDDLVVDFGGFRALNHTTLTIDRAEITGIIGPNGAGKTTLLNVLTGVVAPTSGRAKLGDVELTELSSQQISRQGLTRTFQNLRLFSSLTVRENIAVAALRDRRGDDAEEYAQQLLGAVGLWDVRDRRARELDYGNARRLELARAAATEPHFLLLDEPTSGMNETESLKMADDVRRLASLIGAGVVVIDHDLGFITGLCDKVYCLDQGAVVASGTPAEIQADEIVRAIYLGGATAASEVGETRQRSEIKG